MKEEWRKVEEDPRYEVSSLGRVRGVRGRVLKASFASNGYRRVTLGHSNYQNVHVLVAKAFLGLCPIGHEARHKNDIKADNRIANLAWGSRSENVQDAYRNQKFVCDLSERTLKGWTTRRRRQHG